jgi:hypothetical protein
LHRFVFRVRVRVRVRAHQNDGDGIEKALGPNLAAAALA